MIERSFTLWTDMFEATTPSPHFINERCFGEDFAVWLIDRTRRLALTPSEPVQEDWGWSVVLPFKGGKYTLSIGIMDESIGKVPSEWRVGVMFETPLNGLRYWFRPAPRAELAELARLIEDILRGEPRIGQVANEGGSPNLPAESPPNSSMPR